MTSNDLKGFSAKLLVATSASFESDRLIEFREKKHNDRSAKPSKKFQPNNTFTARKDFFPFPRQTHTKPTEPSTAQLFQSILSLHNSSPWAIAPATSHCEIFLLFIKVKACWNISSASCWNSLKFQTTCPLRDDVTFPFRIISALKCWVSGQQ